VSHEPTHASFFSGVGGLDIGLERAGWRTVSFSEIDPYASAVLAERWPGVPNLGCIRTVASELAPHEQHRLIRGELVCVADDRRGVAGPRVERGADGIAADHDGDWRRAVLWTGGFPCQDLSVAGKRRGLAGLRSGLAFSFLDLVGRHRPRFVLLENVPGLLSSHGGKDLGTLLSTLVELGYGVGYRVLDARYFGVPQRRRRVFILGDSLGGRAGAERAAEVLSVGSRCHRHPPTGIEAGPGAAAGARSGVDIARAVTGTSGKRHDDDTDTLIPVTAHSVRPRSGMPQGWNANLVRSSPDSRRMRAPDELAGRSHDRDGLADTLREHPRPGSNSNGALIAETLNSGGNSGGFRTEPRAHLVTAFTKSHNVAGDDDPETWEAGREARSMNGFDGDRTTLVLGDVADDPLLPLGLDSHRYRCCGNGVVADVAYWIGRRLMDLMETAA